MTTKPANATVSAGLLVACVLGVGAVLAMVSGLQNMDRDYGDGLMDALVHGRTLHPSVWRLAWRALPCSGLQLPWLVHYPALAVVGLWVALAWCVIRLCLGKSWLAVALACLPILPAIFLVVRIALSDGVDPSNAGPWAALAYLSWLYALIACGAFCVLDIRQARQSSRSQAAPVEPRTAPI